MLENKDQNLTPIEQLGEFGLIKHLTQHFELTHQSSLKGIGDDAAVLDLTQKKRKSLQIHWSKEFILI